MTDPETLRHLVAARRDFLARAAIGATALLVGCGRPESPSAAAEEPERPEQEISPTEDLMREHGVLNRILLIYERGSSLIDSAPSDLPPDTLVAAATLIKQFIEDYHEKLEETHLFPLFEQAGMLTDLVATLRVQHRAGRRLTEEIRRLAADSRTLAVAENRRSLGTAIKLFVRMYRPHEAREDTVLFPAVRGLVTPEEFDGLGEQFEREEQQRFGEGGFEDIVERVAAIETRLGIHDLEQFTPPEGA